MELYYDTKNMPNHKKSNLTFVPCDLSPKAKASSPLAVKSEFTASIIFISN